MNGYARFERFMRVLVAIAVTAIAYCLASVADRAFVPVMPAFRTNDTVVVMAIVTGVGGTLTLLGYGAWIREKGYLREDSIPLMRIDCASAYVITGAVMSALILLASATLRVRGIVTDSEGAARAAFAELGALLTGFPLGRHVFALGFWAIVLSAMTGVFQSVPHLFAEGWFAFRGEALPDDVDRTPVYRIYQGVALACGCGLVFFRIPVLYLLYSAVSALFMPFLAANLLYFNSRSDMPARHRNRLGATVVLVLGFALFAYIGVAELGKALARLG